LGRVHCWDFACRADEAVIHRFIGHLRAVGLADNGMATYINRLKVFSAWMRKMGWTERDRFEDIKRPKLVRPRFDTLCRAERRLSSRRHGPRSRPTAPVSAPPRGMRRAMPSPGWPRERAALP
jgi:hypothetical protein